MIKAGLPCVVNPAGSLTIPGYTGQLSPDAEFFMLVDDNPEKPATPERPPILIGLKQGEGIDIALK